MYTVGAVWRGKKKKHLGKDEKLYAAFMDLEKTHERDDRKTL